MPPLHRTHRFLAAHAFYPLALATLLSFALFAGRVLLSRSPLYAFMVWNLFLAGIPYAFALLAAALHQRSTTPRALLLVLVALWLAFLPNAPYILTDLCHLREHPGVPYWYEVGFFVTFAMTGLLFGVVSLGAIHAIIAAKIGWPKSWLFVLGAAGLSGLGVYLGRFLRWNSWDLLANPERVLRDVAAPVLHPRQNLQAYGVTLLFAALLLIAYLTFIAGRPRPSRG